MYPFVYVLISTTGLTKSLKIDFQHAKAVAIRYAEELKRQAKWRASLRLSRKGQDGVSPEAKTRGGETVQYSCGRDGGIAKCAKCDAMTDGTSVCTNTHESPMKLVCRLAKCCGKSYVHSSCCSGTWCGQCSPADDPLPPDSSDYDSDVVSSDTDASSSDSDAVTVIPTTGALIAMTAVSELSAKLQVLVQDTGFAKVAAKVIQLDDHVPTEGVHLCPFLNHGCSALAVFTPDHTFVFDPRQAPTLDNAALLLIAERSDYRNVVTTYLKTYPHNQCLKPSQISMRAHTHVLRAAACMLRAFQQMLEADDLNRPSLGVRYTYQYHTHQQVQGLAKILIGVCHDSLPEEWVSYIVKGIPPICRSRVAKGGKVDGVGKGKCVDTLTVSDDDKGEGDGDGVGPGNTVRVKGGDDGVVDGHGDGQGGDGGVGDGHGDGTGGGKVDGKGEGDGDGDGPGNTVRVKGGGDGVGDGHGDGTGGDDGVGDGHGDGTGGGKVDGRGDGTGDTDGDSTEQSSAVDGVADGRCPAKGGADGPVIKPDYPCRIFAYTYITLCPSFRERDGVCY